jgi:hypothetical protein
MKHTKRLARWKRNAALAAAGTMTLLGCAGALVLQGGEPDAPWTPARAARDYLHLTNRDVTPVLPRIAASAGEKMTEARFLALLGEEREAASETVFLTREAAASLLYAHMSRAGYQKDAAAGSLAMFADGVTVAREHAEAVAELARIGVYPPGELLRPRDPFDLYEAVAWISRAKDARTKQTESETLAGMLACVISAMRAEGLWTLEGAPDGRTSSLALYKAAAWRVVPAELCDYSENGVVILSQAGMKRLYDGMFRGAFSALDTAPLDGRAAILGDAILFFPKPTDVSPNAAAQILTEKRDIEVTIGSVRENADGTRRAYCTVFANSVYFRTAEAVLEPAGWANGRIRSLSLTAG